MTTETSRRGGDPKFASDAVAATPTASATGGMTRWLCVVLAVVIVAGGLFGYDQGVISAALPGILLRQSLSIDAAIFCAASSHFASFNRNFAYPVGKMAQKNSQPSVNAC